MKKLLSLVLVLVLLTSSLACAEGMLTGGWTFRELGEAVPQEASDALAKADNYADFEAVITAKELLGTQVVAGTNYMLLCRVDYNDSALTSDYAFVCVYAALDGTSTIISYTCTDYNYVPWEWTEEEGGYQIDGYEIEFYEECTILTARLLSDQDTGDKWDIYVSDESILELIISGVEGDVCAASFRAAEGAESGTAFVKIDSAKTFSDGSHAASLHMVVNVSKGGVLDISDLSFSRVSE